jgi:hypothetical protein
MAIKDENGKVTGWSFAIVGSDVRHVTKFIGFKETYEDAVEYRTNMAKIGWRNVQIYDVNLQKVKERPESTE